MSASHESVASDLKASRIGRYPVHRQIFPIYSEFMKLHIEIKSTKVTISSEIKGSKVLPPNEFSTCCMEILPPFACNKLYIFITIPSDKIS